MNIDPKAWEEALRNRLRIAIADDIRSLTSGIDPDDVLGVGAYTDADASNVVVAVQTRPHYESLVARRPQYRNYFRWSIGEWDRLSFEELDDDPLQAINEELAAAIDGRDEGGAIDEFRATVWNAVVGAIADIARAGDLDAFPNAVRVFEPVDADVSEERIRDWTASINDPAQTAQYDAWAANPSS